MFHNIKVEIFHNFLVKYFHRFETNPNRRTMCSNCNNTDTSTNIYVLYSISNPGDRQIFCLTCLHHIYTKIGFVFDDLEIEKTVEKVDRAIILDRDV